MLRSFSKSRHEIGKVVSLPRKASMAGASSSAETAPRVATFPYKLLPTFYRQQTTSQAQSQTVHLEVPVREALLSDVYQTLSNSRAQAVRRFPSLGFRCVAPAPHAAPETVENPLSQPQSCDKLVDKVVFKESVHPRIY